MKPNIVKNWYLGLWLAVACISLFRLANGWYFFGVCVWCVSLEYADALTNPIKHLSGLSERENKLAGLMEDFNVEVRHSLTILNNNQLYLICAAKQS